MDIEDISKLNQEELMRRYNDFLTKRKESMGKGRNKVRMVLKKLSIEDSWVDRNPFSTEVCPECSHKLLRICNIDKLDSIEMTGDNFDFEYIAHVRIECRYCDFRKTGYDFEATTSLNARTISINGRIVTPISQK